MHIDIDDYPSFENISQNIQRLGALGLEVHITEMDVRCTNCTAVRAGLSLAHRRKGTKGKKREGVSATELAPLSTQTPPSTQTPHHLQDRQQLQSKVYAGVVKACLSHPGVCKSIEMWGFTDKHSWLNSKYNNPEPLLFDTEYRKKAAYFAVLKALQE